MEGRPRQAGRIEQHRRARSCLAERLRQNREDLVLRGRPLDHRWTFRLTCDYYALKSRDYPQSYGVGLGSVLLLGVGQLDSRAVLDDSQDGGCGTFERG